MTTPAFLNQIFYKNKTFGENFEILQKYTFTTAFKDRAFSECQSSQLSCQPQSSIPIITDTVITMNPYTKTQSKPQIPIIKECHTPSSPQQPPPPPPNSQSTQITLYDPSPENGDTLFWSIYIGMHGYSEYQCIKTNYAVFSLNEKKKIAEFLNSTENKKKMKATAYKVSKGGIQEIQSDCHTQTLTTSFPTIIAMSVFYEKNIWVVDKNRKVFLKFNGKSVIENDGREPECKREIPCMIIYKTAAKNPKYKPTYVVETCPTVVIVDQLYAEMICLEHYELPIKCASNYKMDDLEHMAEVLGIDILGGKKVKKIDLYDLVKQKCIWNDK